MCLLPWTDLQIVPILHKCNPLGEHQMVPAHSVKEVLLQC
jgi:hypothetical protein